METVITKLPDKPSELIRLALEDLEKAEKSKKYNVNMNCWHRHFGDRICQVCFAGAVMAFHLKADPFFEGHPTDFDVNTEKKLRALNSFRSGDISMGMLHMGISPTLPWDMRTFWQYEESPAFFKKDMRLLANEFENAGY